MYTPTTKNTKYINEIFYLICKNNFYALICITLNIWPLRIHTLHVPSFLQNERTRIDKVRRLLDDLVRRGSNAYHDFLEILRETGYEYLANEIVNNEEILRRENTTKYARAEIHTSTTFNESKQDTAVESPLVTSEISNSNSTSLGSFGLSSASRNSSESILPPTRAESSNVQPHLGGLVVLEVGKIYML